MPTTLLVRLPEAHNVFPRVQSTAEEALSQLRDREFKDGSKLSYIAAIRLLAANELTRVSIVGDNTLQIVPDDRVTANKRATALDRLAQCDCYVTYASPTGTN